MNQQKCRICGERHRLGACPQHQQPAETLSAANQPKRQTKPRDPIAAVHPAHPPTHQQPFDRNAYMRDYMRKRRAKQPS